MTTAQLKLVEPPAAPEPAEIARWITPQIAEQIERAAWWPGHTPREDWKLGDYSAYALAFPAHGFKLLNVRFMSEPDAMAMVDVSAGHDAVNFRTAAPDALRAALAAAGFRPGGGRAGYSKRVLVESREDCQALAEEIAGLVTGCLGYAGREPIQHLHAFKSRTRPAQVFTALTLNDVERLLCSSKLVVSTRNRKAGPGFWTVEQPRFLVAPYQETWPASGWYRALNFLYTLPIETELAEGVIEVMRRRRPFAEVRALDGELRLELRVQIEGGVTEEYLRVQLKYWRGFVATVTAVVRRLEADAED